MVDAARRRGPLRASSSAFLIRGYRPRATRLKPPRRFEIRHGILACRRVASIMRILQHARRDRPKPFAVCRCRVRPHDAANVPFTIERIVVVGSPLAARAGFVGLF
jgi:hypothetical protein